MELGSQIKKYRTNMNISQEELAEKIYVTRQTISNWENNKSYPDIHSLLLLSSLFQVSPDQLIKGDVKIMKEEINKVEIQHFNRDGAIFSLVSVSESPASYCVRGYRICSLYHICMAIVIISIVRQRARICESTHNPSPHTLMPPSAFYILRTGLTNFQNRSGS